MIAQKSEEARSFFCFLNKKRADLSLFSGICVLNFTERRTNLRMDENGMERFLQMKNRICFCMAAVLGIWLLGSGCSRENVPAGVLLENALVRAESGDWAAAGDLAGKVLKQEKNNVDALLIKALAESNLGKSASALDHALLAATLAKDSFLSQYIKGMLLYRAGKHALAIAPLQEANRLRPGDINTLVLLAKSTFALKKYNAAAGYFARIARTERYRRSPLPWNGIGVCMAYFNPGKALPYFRMASERIAPGDGLTHYNLAVLYDSYLQNRSQAIRSYERFLEQAIGKMEFDDLRARAELRLDTLKNR